MNACFGKVKYKLGAKAGLHATPGEDFTKIDCSGFVRWLLFQCGNGFAAIPDGSWNQWEWCKREGFKESTYDKNGAGLCDSRLRIAFIRAKPGSSGHIWLIINGQTIESYSPVGVKRRPWNYKTLKNNVAAVYVLTEPLK